MPLLTRMQLEALERGYDIMNAALLLSTYVLTNVAGHDDHLNGLLNLVARMADKYDEAWNGAYREHEAAEKALADQIDALAGSRRAS